MTNKVDLTENRDFQVRTHFYGYIGGTEHLYLDRNITPDEFEIVSRRQYFWGTQMPNENSRIFIKPLSAYPQKCKKCKTDLVIPWRSILCKKCGTHYERTRIPWNNVCAINEDDKGYDLFRMR